MVKTPTDSKPMMNGGGKVLTGLGVALVALLVGNLVAAGYGQRITRNETRIEQVMSQLTRIETKLDAALGLKGN